MSCRQICSFLSIPFCLSATALSVGAWLSVMLIRIWCSMSVLTYSRQAYWEPLSEWCIVPHRRPPPLGAGRCQAFRCEEPQEGVAPARHLRPQFGLQDDMELYAPKARPSPSVVLHAGHKQLAALTLRDVSAMTRIVPLAVLAKQSAEEPDIQPGELLPQRLYCLAPPFFNIEMPSSCSAICIIFSKARLRSFSSSSARSRSEMRFRRISSLLSFVS